MDDPTQQDERKPWPRWPTWGLLILAAFAYLVTVKMMPYPVPDAEYMGRQLMMPGNTLTFEIGTGVSGIGGAHTLREPSVVVEVEGDEGWEPAPQQPTIVETSGTPLDSASASAVAGKKRSKITAWIRFAVPDDQTLRGSSARLSIPLYVDYFDDAAAAAEALKKSEAAAARRAERAAKRGKSAKKAPTKSSKKKAKPKKSTVPGTNTWHKTYTRKFVYSPPDLESKIAGWHSRRKWLRVGAIALFIGAILFWFVRRTRESA